MRALKPVVFMASLLPVGLLAWRAWTHDLTPNPIEFITHQTGDWTLRFLLVTLAITPIRRVTGWHSVIRLRRMLGLFAFFYGVLHLMTFVVLDYFFAFDLMLAQVAEQPFITAGATSFFLMTPLAATSTQAMVRRLGGRRWRNLHRLVYVSVLAGVVHYTWQSKIDLRRPLMYAAGLAVLLGFRLWHFLRHRPSGSLSGAPRAQTDEPR
jgi:methionine sulfoxide reductase heme-binding subunit